MFQTLQSEVCTSIVAYSTSRRCMFRVSSFHSRYSLMYSSHSTVQCAVSLPVVCRDGTFRKPQQAESIGEQVCYHYRRGGGVTNLLAKHRRTRRHAWKARELHDRRGNCVDSPSTTPHLHMANGQSSTRVWRAGKRRLVLQNRAFRIRRVSRMISIMHYHLPGVDDICIYRTR